MTDKSIDLLCQPKFLVGLIGSLSFISYSVGSVLLTRYNDIYGRKLTIQLTGLMTPVGMVAMLVLEYLGYLSVYIIIAVMFTVGLTYSARGSTSYLYGTEFLNRNYHLFYGQVNFILSGIILAAAGPFFYYTKSQTLWFYILIGLMAFSLIWTTCFAPESPYFLYEMEKWEELEKAFSKITKFNGNYDKKSIEFVVQKLKDQKEKEKAA